MEKDKYGVQNGKWRLQKVEIQEIKRITYTNNKNLKKEYKQGKIASISTISKKQTEQTRSERKNSKEKEAQQHSHTKSVNINQQDQTLQKTKPTTSKQEKTSQTNIECPNCKSLYDQLQEEKFQRLLAENQAEFWENLHKKTELERKRLEEITKKVKRKRKNPAEETNHQISSTQ